MFNSKRTRRAFLKTVAGVGIGASLLPFSGCNELPSQNKQSPPPNIIFIMADDLGYGGLGCYGAKQIPTPNCDKLAQEGVRFTDAHSGSAVCTPTRYGVLTGRYSWRSWLKNWVIGEHMPLLIDTNRMTVASMLKSKGYKTACVGKWHLGWGTEIHPDWNKNVAPGPLDVGFDYYFGAPYSHNCKMEVYVENDRVYGLKEGENLEDEVVAKRVHRRLEDTAIELSKRAVSFIEKNKDEPFFLYYPTTNIHQPHTPNERFTGKTQLGKYGDFVTEFDWAVGQIRSTLDRLKLTDNTLIIVTSDNGAKRKWGLDKQHKPNGNWRGDKATIYEGGHRIPFIARWPGRIKPGTTSDETICLTDLMATCASLTGQRLPHNAAEDSFDISPALFGSSCSKPVRPATIHHSVSGMFAIRKGDWKLIEGLGDGYRPANFPKVNRYGKDKPIKDPQTGQFQDLRYPWEPAPSPEPGQPAGQLYNLKTDPQEEHNLWDKHPEVVKELLELLNQYRTSGRSRTSRIDVQ